MSSMHVPRVISQRGKSSLEVERENFERTQTTSIHKAINQQETPVKEKHVRTAVIGTFTEKGASMFWSVTSKMSLQGHPITCWKFCCVLHKILRDGHHTAMIDSQKYSSHITDLGKLWGHLKEGYGKLIRSYTKLLVQKLAFHRKNPEIPGNLVLTEEELEKITRFDVNLYFELSVDMLDYMDGLLMLAAAVFGSLDMSRANSMTASGQCRLAALIPCIHDSCHLYDHLVKLLFRLHSSLPPDTLVGHRDRFHAQFKGLKQFYHSSHNLQYFKNLIQVPSLPDEPPNFLVASDYSMYERPVVTVPDPEPEPEIETPEVEAREGTLIDTSTPDLFSNGAPSPSPPPPPTPDDRDLIIERLMRQVQALQAELEKVKQEDQEIIRHLQERLAQLETELNDMRQIAQQSNEENEALRGELRQSSQNAEAAIQLIEAQKNSKIADDKFKKMKDIYSKLREEHVALLRSHADVTRQLASERNAVKEQEQQSQDIEEKLRQVEREKSLMSENLQKSADDSASQLALTMATNEALERSKEELEKKIESLGKTIENLESALKNSEGDVTSRAADILAMQKKLEDSENERLQMEAANKALEQKKEEIEKILEDTKKTVEDLESSLKQSQEDTSLKAADILALQKKLEENESERLKAEALLRKQLSDENHQFLVTAIEEGESIIKDSLSEFENPTHDSVTCTAEYLLHRVEPLLTCLDTLQTQTNTYTTDPNSVHDLVKIVCEFSHRMGDSIINGKATSHVAPIEQGEELAKTCKQSGDDSLALLNTLKEGNYDKVDGKITDLKTLLQGIITQAEDLVPKVEDVKAEQMGDLVEQEMQSTTDAIEAAAKKMAEMLAKSREKDSGIQLEVNENILDSCTALMMAIKVLILKSKALQREIVDQGRGTASDKEFYKKHHRWTEGLLSAAKSVGLGANMLLDGADKVVNGEGKFEEVMVCAQEIAASTAQLVVASKVKSDKNSANLREVSDASKKVSECTGNVVASAKSGAQLIEDKDTMDFTKLSLTQTKRMEMNSQVKVLELESNLEKERVKLAGLRKQHYKLGGEDEGWSDEES
ncbi:unnamed protein product [Owenia fusiformis]|uniref:Uncharacterized protein n=1 Tax=Owenia fusiformis TaxID=6347 RepID=A0A8J1XLL4_OWEFU|nr:unnamed protein product [Owenia fusiformis]